MMRSQKWLVAILAVGVVIAWSHPLWAADERPTRGTVQNVNADQHQLTIKDRDGKNWTFHILDNAVIFEPNQASTRLNDLKSGDDVSLLWMRKGGDQFQASALLRHEGMYRDAELAAGTIKNIASDNQQVIATDRNGKQWTYHLADNAKFFGQNGKNMKVTDFQPNTHVVIVWDKKGDQYRVLSMCQDPAQATR